MWSQCTLTRGLMANFETHYFGTCTAVSRVTVNHGFLQFDPFAWSRLVSWCNTRLHATRELRQCIKVDVLCLNESQLLLHAARCLQSVDRVRIHVANLSFVRCLIGVIYRWICLIVIFVSSSHSKRSTPMDLHFFLRRLDFRIALGCQ